MLIITDYVLKPANNYCGEMFDIDDNELQSIAYYENCLIEYKSKKYFVKTKEYESLNKRKPVVRLRKKILCETL